MRPGSGRRIAIVGVIAAAALATGLFLSAAAARPGGLTPAEQSALRIVSVQARGAEPAGLVVDVTFAGNLEKAIGRGNLKNALVAVILHPKDAQFATADLATEGAGPIGVTSKKSRLSTVGVFRDGRKLTFFIAGPGSSNVGTVEVKAFASSPARKSARRTAGRAVTPEQWEQIEDAIATQERRVEVLDAFASGRPGDDCIQLRQMLNDARKGLAKARLRQDDFRQLQKKIDAAIEQVNKKIGLHVDFAAGVAHSIGAPIGVVLTIANGQTPAQQAQSWKDLLRTLKLDRRLADALLERNQKLIESFTALIGRLEGLHAAKCRDSGTAAPTDFGVGVKTSYHHPGGDTSTLCALVSTLPPKPRATARVQVTGPGVVGPADQTKTLDGKGEAVANVTIDVRGTYTVTATVSADGLERSATESQTVTTTQASCPPR